MEERIVTSESSLPFRAIPAAALRGRDPVALARGVLTSARGTAAAARLIGELRPAAILGTGGYVCVPLFLAARARRVPTMIYLPDVVPGLAVRFLSRIATLSAVNVEDALPNLGFTPDDAPSASQSGRDRESQIVRRKWIVTGYPVRRELFEQDRAACRRAFGLAEDLPVILVYGGSRGARSVNRAIAALLPDLLERSALIHVCGREGDAEWLRAAAAQLPDRLHVRYKLYEYLASGPQSMVAAFGAADLAVCRSGASTLAELPAAGLPAVLVPYPYVHQDENADYLVRRGAAAKVADDAMLGSGHPRDGALFRAVVRLLDGEYERKRMAERSRALARPDAARSLAEALLNLAARSGS